jgi:hypothetical protein
MKNNGVGDQLDAYCKQNPKSAVFIIGLATSVHTTKQK